MMVHLVRKEKQGNVYLALQKSVHLKYIKKSAGTKGKSKKTTRHVAYLGNTKNYNKKQLKEILRAANHKPMIELLKTIRRIKNENKRAERQAGKRKH